MEHPGAVLLCPPDAFEVREVKNPFMEGQIGRVDRAAARRQWEALRAAFVSIGLRVETIPAAPGLEDMVFTANQTFVGLDAAGARVCVPSLMRHPSRRREVPHFVRWFAARGYRVERIEAARFEGSGDAIWQPRRRAILGGVGPRTSAEAYPALARIFGAEVVTVDLATEDFYHLDTCLCAVDERTAMLHPPAFTTAGLRAIRARFERIVEVDEEEARRSMACNAAAFFGTHVVMQRGAERAASRLRALGYEVVEVDTSEFLKSGGSVFCLKQSLW